MSAATRGLLLAGAVVIGWCAKGASRSDSPAIAVTGGAVTDNLSPGTIAEFGDEHADVLPPGILQKVDLKSPATSVALLKLNAVLGVKAEVDANNHITRLGFTWGSGRIPAVRRAVESHLGARP
jgi:hypothetical protein